jgi:4-amino-4-deoxy-L-arabinose transferase-like glycosyltransferase
MMILRPRLIVLLLIAFALIRVAMTFRVFSATVDEATHIGAGLELIQLHRYQVHRENPPLPRIILSAAPWLGGMRYNPEGGFIAGLHSVFYGNGKYERNLVLARSGNLFFFALAAWTVWILARGALGDAGALIALFLFTTEPIVLGYSGLATHDAAGVAGTGVALIAFLRWLRAPDLSRALLFGAAFGFSILCKFTCIVDVPVACIAIATLRVIQDRELRRQIALASLAMVPSVVVTLFIVWAGYGFTLRPLGDLAPWWGAFGPRIGSMVARLDPATRIPAPDFFIGIANLRMIDASGMNTYLWGHSGKSGWWWYFPFALLLKISLAALALFIAGLWLTRRERDLRGPCLEFSAAALSIVAIAMTSKLDIGVRYLLPFFVPFAVASAAGVLAMGRRGLAGKGIVIALLVFHAGVSLGAHPDYFPYFNVLAGREPSRYLIDSNLDWGQDALRLRTVIRKLKITRIGLSLIGPADYAALGYPEVYSANPALPLHGWLAISDHERRMSEVDGGWRWLRENPVQRVGKSISLYKLP